MSRSLKDIEEHIRAEISQAQLQEHLEVFSTLFRDTGSEDEWRAARYVVDKLHEYGVEAEILEFDSLISWPLEGSFRLISGEDVIEDIEVRTRSFGAQTETNGLEAELVYVPLEGQSDGVGLIGSSSARAYFEDQDIAGKIILTFDGGPGGVLRAQEAGAAGHIHIWPSDEDVVHEMISTSIWGTPTPEAAARLPKIPSMGVKHSDGVRVAEMLQQRQLRARVESNVKTEWMRVPLATGYIPGLGSEDFLLVGGHIDSWYEGVTDNATGDASLIEMARVLAPAREHLRCGVRFCWWPGHSTGRYSGSTWFADHFFTDLREHGLGYLNIDSPGVRETSTWDCRYNCAEIEHITAEAVEELSGLAPNIRRPVRAGDQSFLGVGLPSLGAFRMLATDHPDRKSVGGGGGAYWWHSPLDTLDKADANILAQDTEIYVAITLRMCAPEVIPYRYSKTADDFIEHLKRYQQTAGEHIDLTPAVSAAERLIDVATDLEAADPENVTAFNEGLKQIGRVVNPVLLTANGPYEMDPAVQLPALPGLAGIDELVSLDSESDDYRFLYTKLVRERNRIHDALLWANSIADGIATL